MTTLTHTKTNTKSQNTTHHIFANGYFPMKLNIINGSHKESCSLEITKIL